MEPEAIRLYRRSTWICDPYGDRGPYVTGIFQPSNTACYSPQSGGAWRPAFLRNQRTYSVHVLGGPKRKRHGFLYTALFSYRADVLAGDPVLCLARRHRSIT